MANYLTLTRMLLIVPIALLLIGAPGTGARWVAFGLFLLAGITDFFDGWLARKLDEVSALGAALDPIADKLLTAALLLLLAADGTIQGWHLLAALVILLREVLIVGLREALAGAITLPVTFAAKVKTTVQFIALALLLAPVAGSREAGLAALWTAALLTVWTGAHYVTASVRHLQKP